MPAAMVAREILQHAHNLAEALGILGRAKVFVSSLWLVGSRADGRCVVAEKTPETPCLIVDLEIIGKAYDLLRRYLGRDGSDVAWDLIRLAWMSVSDYALTTLQDVLNLGTESRMNYPGHAGGRAVG